MRRRILAGLLFLGAMAPALPAEATESWSPGGDFGSPTLTLPIHVVDGVRSTLTGERRRLYTASLKRALSWWGLPFEVTYRPESEQPYIATDENVSTLSSNPLVVFGTVTIVRSRFAVISDSAGWVDVEGGGLAFVQPWSGWWNDGRGLQISSVVAHEVGHALGFGHHDQKGVMGGGGRPSEMEQQLVAEYFGVSIA